MEPNEREEADVAEVAGWLVENYTDGDAIEHTVVVLPWPVWIGLPSKRSTSQAMFNPLLIVLTEAHALGVRLATERWQRGYAGRGNVEFAEPVEGLQITRAKGRRADLVVPSRSLLIHARAQRQWRTRFAALLERLPSGRATGAENLLV